MAQNPRELASRFTSDVASYLQSQGIQVAPQLERGEYDDFKVGRLVGLDDWSLRTRRAYRVDLSEALNAVEAEAAELGKPFSGFIQYRSAHDAASQFAVMSLAGLSRVLRAMETR